MLKVIYANDKARVVKTGRGTYTVQVLTTRFLDGFPHTGWHDSCTYTKVCSRDWRGNTCVYSSDCVHKPRAEAIADARTYDNKGGKHDNKN